MPHGNRRSDRISIALQLQVFGSDAEGSQFIEPARTISISRHGAMIAIERKLVPEQELTILRIDTNEEADVRVVGHIKEHLHGGEAYGVTLLDPAKDLWHVEFPALTRPEEALASVVLACSRCGSQRVTHLSEVELEVLGAGHGLMLDCKSCANSTIWMQASSETVGEVRRRPIGTGPQSKRQPAPSQNERRHGRATVNLPACIRQSSLEEVVVSEDASRGGLRFKSHNRYFIGLRVEVAMPYSTGTGNMFVPARIVYCRELPDGSFMHGLSYLKSERS